MLHSMWPSTPGPASETATNINHDKTAGNQCTTNTPDGNKDNRSMINYPNDAPSHILQCVTLHISLLTLSTDHYYSCINSIVTFADHEAPHFSMTCFSNKPQWGNNLRNKNYLHLHEQPIAIWLQGTTTFINLHQKANQWAVTLCPSSITTLDKAHSLPHDSTKPQTSLLTLITLICQPTNHYTAYEDNSTIVNIYQFNNDHKKFNMAYDATKYLCPWPEMEADKINGTMIHTPNMILIEFLLKCYWPSSTVPNKKNH